MRSFFNVYKKESQNETLICLFGISLFIFKLQPLEVLIQYFYPYDPYGSLRYRL